MTEDSACMNFVIKSFNEIVRLEKKSHTTCRFEANVVRILSKFKGKQLR